MITKRIHEFPLTLLDVVAKPNLTLKLEFKYSDTSRNYEVTVRSGLVYSIKYLEEGKIKQVIGKVAGVGRLFDAVTNQYPRREIKGYLIRIDASSNQSSMVVDIPSYQIRDMKEFVEFGDEDPTIQDATVRGGVTYGTIYQCTISNPVKNDKGEVIGGIISDGITDYTKITVPSINDSVNASNEVKEHDCYEYECPTLCCCPKNRTTYTEGGCACGMNSSGHYIYTINGYTYNGTITSGEIVTGAIKLGPYVEEENKFVNCSISDAVIKDVVLRGALNSDGDVFTPFFRNAVVVCGDRTGKDLVSKSMTVLGNIGSGGYAEGGEINSCTAIATLNGQTFIIKNGLATGGRSVGGKLSGGKITDGVQIGDAFVKATVEGGVYVGGTGYGMDVRPTSATTIWTTDIQTPKTPPEAINTIVTPAEPTNDNWDGLVVFDDRDSGIGSNIGTANI